MNERGGRRLGARRAVGEPSRVARRESVAARSRPPVAAFGRVRHREDAEPDDGRGGGLRAVAPSHAPRRVLERRAKRRKRRRTLKSFSGPISDRRGLRVTLRSLRLRLGLLLPRPRPHARVANELAVDARREKARRRRRERVRRRRRKRRRGRGRKDVPLPLRPLRLRGVVPPADRRVDVRRRDQPGRRANERVAEERLQRFANRRGEGPTRGRRRPGVGV